MTDLKAKFEKKRDLRLKKYYKDVPAMFKDEEGTTPYGYGMQEGADWAYSELEPLLVELKLTLLKISAGIEYSEGRELAYEALTLIDNWGKK